MSTEADPHLIALSLLAGPNHDNIEDPYEHLFWDILLEFRNRMPELNKYLRSSRFLFSLAANSTNPVIRDPNSGQLYFHRNMIEKFNTKEREFLKLLAKEKMEPLKKKRHKPPTPVGVNTIKTDYNYFCLWQKGALFQLAKKLAANGGREGGDKAQVEKRKHSSLMKKAKRFADGVLAAILRDYEVPDEKARTKILRLSQLKEIDDALWVHSKNLLKLRLEMSATSYAKKFGQKPPKNLLEEYINSRLRYAYCFLNAGTKFNLKPE